MRMRMIEWTALSDYIRQRAKTAEEVDLGTVLDVLEWIADAPMTEVEETRVLELEELVGFDGAVWVEYNPDKVVLEGEWMFVDFVAEYVKPKAIYMIRRHGKQVVYKDSGYGVTWRCWNRKPSEGEREATPWTA